jgi:hypothetical protein
MAKRGAADRNKLFDRFHFSQRSSACRAYCADRREHSLFTRKSPTDQDAERSCSRAHASRPARDACAKQPGGVRISRHPSPARLDSYTSAAGTFVALAGAVVGKSTFVRVCVAAIAALLSLSRCSCEETLNRIEDPSRDAREEDRIALDSGASFESERDAAEPAPESDGGTSVEPSEPDAGTMVPDTSEPDAGVSEPDSGEPDAGVTIADLCATAQRQTSARTFTFGDVGPCPWGQGDNNPVVNGGGWNARTEQVERITDIPSNAIICAAAFEVPQTAMYFDDAMVIALQGVILMTDVNVSVFSTDGRFYFYDWPSMVGTGGSSLYCLGQSTGEGSCSLPPMETPGPMSLEISSALAQAIGEHAARQASYEIQVVTVGDNDANDCRHEPFDFIVTLEWVVP